MIYLSGRFCKNKNIGLMLSFNANHTTKNMIKTFKVIGIDNGCYSKPEKYDDELYLQYLNKLDFRDSLFATAPDVVGDYKLTRKRSYPMFKKIRDIGYKVAYVGQDGEDGTDLDFTLFDCLFIGGTTEWKLSQEAYKLIRLAKQHGKWIHMGRVNSFKRMRVAGAIGVDSVDGTYICWDTDYRINQLNEWLKNVNNQYYLGFKLMKYVSTKTYGHERGLSCAFRQPNAESHCKYIHGYALSFTFVFGCNELDNNNWVVDFGSLKTLKNWLEQTFDHKLLIDKNDPQIDQFEIFEHSNFCQLVLVDGVGCEKFAEHSFNFADKFIKKITDNRCWVESVEVKEHGSNSAIVMRDT